MSIFQQISNRTQMQSKMQSIEKLWN